MADQKPPYIRMMLRHKRAHERLQERAKKGEIIELTSQHPDPKLAELGAAFEKMQEHPIAKRFRRNRVHLYITEDSIVSLMTEGAAVTNIKSIEIPPHYLELSTASEIKFVIGHELGHLLFMGYIHPRRELSLLEIINKDKYYHKMEYVSDTLGLVLSGEPASSFASFLEKTRVLHYFLQNCAWGAVAGMASDPGRYSENVRAFLQEYGATLAIKAHMDCDTHPSDIKRNARNEETYRKLQTPEGRAEVEAKLISMIEAEHRKIFHHRRNYRPSSPGRA